MSVFYIWHPTNMTLNSATVRIYRGQIYTVRWQLKNITTLVPGECVNILKSYYTVWTILSNAWGIVHSYWSFISLLILSWYALLVVVSLTSSSWETPLKLRDSPLNTTPVGFLPIHQCNVDKFVRVSDARWEYVCKRNRFRVWIHLKRWHFPNFNTISNPLGPFKCLAVCTFLLAFLLIIGFLLCTITFNLALNTQKCT